METTDGTLAIIRAYHRGWTGKNFDEAISFAKFPKRPRFVVERKKGPGPQITF